MGPLKISSGGSDATSKKDESLITRVPTNAKILNSHSHDQAPASSALMLIENLSKLYKQQSELKNCGVLETCTLLKT